ncbi:MAG: hypothetical protein ACK4M6_05255 [Hyphomonas sp.]
MMQGQDKRNPVWDIRGWSRDAVISAALQAAHALPEEEPFPEALRGLIQEIRRLEGES